MRLPARMEFSERTTIGNVLANAPYLTHLSGDPRCYWQLLRRRLPSRGVLVCRSYFQSLRQVADTSPPRFEGNHPNPCLALRARPLLDGSDKSPLGQPPTHPLRNLPHHDVLIVFACPGVRRKLCTAGAFETAMACAARLRRRGDEFLMSKIVQLRAAVTPRSFAGPQYLNLMSSDADDRAGSAGLAIFPAHSDDTVA
jgi:hypothetical protein